MERGQYVFRSEFARKHYGRGRQEGIQEIAVKLLSRGVPLAEISEITGLTEAQIIELRDSPERCDP